MFLNQNVEQWVQLESVDSTNDYARRGNLPGGSVVLAREQTAGRGRGAHSWQMQADAALAMSAVLSYKKPPDYFSLLPLLTGLSVLEACRSLLKELNQPEHDFDSYVLARGQLWLKWPNDILLQTENTEHQTDPAPRIYTGKLAGILIENQSKAGSMHCIVGIGVNISGSPPAIRDGGSKFPPAVLIPEWMKTYLTDDNPGSDSTALPQRLAILIIQQLNNNLSQFYQGDLGSLMQRIEDCFYLSNRFVRAGKLTGYVCGLAKSGALLIESEGQLHSLMDSQTDLQILD